MEKDFGRIYRELEQLDPLTGLEGRSFHITADEGLAA